MRLTVAGAMIQLTVAAAILSVASSGFGQSSTTFRVGVWNIEKLSKTTSGRGFPELRGAQELGPRSTADLDEMSRYLREVVKPDALLVTEIAPDGDDSTEAKPRSAHLSHVVQNMGGDWKYFLGRTGGDMRIGFVYNDRRVKLKKISNLTADKFKVADSDIFDRDPFVLWISLIDENGMEQNDFLCVGMHLKSLQKAFIHNRMAAVAKLLGDLQLDKIRLDLGLPNVEAESDIIIVGDCNDSSHQLPGFKFMFDYLQGSGFTHLGPEDDTYPATRVNGSQIDHIFVSSNMIGDTIDAGTFEVHGAAQPDRAPYRRQLSDHFPVTVDVTARQDDDQ